MRTRINVAEILKNCPKGMELDCLAWENLYFEKITDSNIFAFPIKCYVEQNGQKLPVSFTKEGAIFTGINSKCVIFPKGKTTWEGFVPPCEFKNGDIICTDSNGIVIIKDKLAFGYNAYCALKEGGDFYLCAEVTPMRLATEEEKKRLLQAIKGNGYKWDAERKCLIELPKFKNGDILAAGDWVFIFKELHTNGSPRCYCHYDLTLEEFKVDTNSYMAYGGDIYLATKEQQDLLFSKMEGAGYKWNAETKTLDRLINPRFKVGDRIKHVVGREEVATVVGVEDTHYNLDSKGGTSSFTISLQREWELVSKFDINTLKPFDKVLVRDCIKSKWRIQFFDRFKETGNFPFICVGDAYKQCIPYEGNEHLRGKRDDCDEFYKTWED